MHQCSSDQSLGWYLKPKLIKLCSGFRSSGDKETYNWVSSASLWNSILCFLVTSPRGNTYRLKRTGPRMAPCWTPQVILIFSEKESGARWSQDSRCIAGISPQLAGSCTSWKVTVKGDCEESPAKPILQPQRTTSVKDICLLRSARFGVEPRARVLCPALMLSPGSSVGGFVTTSGGEVSRSSAEVMEVPGRWTTEQLRE